MDRNEIDRLKELIRKSGFPLEIEISSILGSARSNPNLKDMNISMGAYYLDAEKNGRRELDMSVRIPLKYRGKFEGKKRSLIGIFLHLLIQCKKNSWKRVGFL